MLGISEERRDKSEEDALRNIKIPQRFRCGIFCLLDAPTIHFVDTSAP